VRRRHKIGEGHDVALCQRDQARKALPDRCKGGTRTRPWVRPLCEEAHLTEWADVDTAESGRAEPPRLSRRLDVEPVADDEPRELIPAVGRREEAPVLAMHVVDARRDDVAAAAELGSLGLVESLVFGRGSHEQVDRVVARMAGGCNHPWKEPRYQPRDRALHTQGEPARALDRPARGPGRSLDQLDWHARTLVHCAGSAPQPA
jgi:hypothetical protein